MVTVPMEIQLLFAGVLFLTGLVGLLVRRNIIFMLMSIEIMLNSAGLAFVIAGSHWMQADGQVMFIFILTVSAAEVSVGLALILQLYHHFRTLDADAINKLHDENVSEKL
jgi:NADH-quinone oxidoreductase subunit K